MPPPRLRPSWVGGEGRGRAPQRGAGPRPYGLRPRPRGCGPAPPGFSADGQGGSAAAASAFAR